MPIALAAALLAVLLPGCSATAPEPVPIPDETRTVVQEAGNVEVPVAPRRVLALDEYAAMSMLALGVRPDVVFATLSSEIGGHVLREAGVTVQAEPSFLYEPDAEKVAAAAPDMIVLSDAGPLPASFAQFNGIAPTVVLPYSRPWRDVLTATGTALDRSEQATALGGALEERIAQVRASLGGPRTLSVLLGWDGLIYTAADSTPLASLVEEAGFTRIAAERGLPTSQDGTIAAISQETVGAHDADAAALLNGGYYDAALVRGAATWAQLPVASRATDVDGDMWFGSHPFAISWILDDLAAIAAGNPAATPADAPARWAAFTQLAATEGS
jgi:iron complex transport system substrate-binding protein